MSRKLAARRRASDGPRAPWPQRAAEGGRPAAGAGSAASVAMPQLGPGAGGSSQGGWSSRPRRLALRLRASRSAVQQIPGLGWASQQHGGSERAGGAVGVRRHPVCGVPSWHEAQERSWFSSRTSPVGAARAGSPDREGRPRGWSLSGFAVAPVSAMLPPQRRLSAHQGKPAHAAGPCSGPAGLRSGCSSLASGPAAVGCAAGSGWSSEARVAFCLAQACRTGSLCRQTQGPCAWFITAVHGMVKCPMSGDLQLAGHLGLHGRPGDAVHCRQRPHEMACGGLQPRPRS